MWEKFVCVDSNVPMSKVSANMHRELTKKVTCRDGF